MKKTNVKIAGMMVGWLLSVFPLMNVHAIPGVLRSERVTVLQAPVTPPGITCNNMEVEIGTTVPAPLVQENYHSGYALRFDGANDRVTFDQDLNAVNAFTYELYVKPTGTHEIDSEGPGNNAEGLSGQKYVIYPGSASLIYGAGHSILGISVGTNGVSVYERASISYHVAVLAYAGTLPTSEFTHIAVSLSNTGPTKTCTLYLNGIQVRQVTYTSPYANVHASLGHMPSTVNGGIGGGFYGHFKGEIDEVRVWDYVRSAVEINSTLRKELTGSEPGLKAYFDFNDGPGNTVATGPLGNAILANMDPNNDWVQYDPMPDYTLTNSYTGTDELPVIATLGSYNITWTATDKLGNASSCVSTVLVTPRLTCPGDIIVNVGSGTCGTYVAIPVPVVFGGTGTETVTNTYTNTNDASGYYKVGPTLVTWNVSGMSKSCSILVTVLDQEVPALVTCPPDITLDERGCGPVDVDSPVVTDNCEDSGSALQFDGIDDAISIDKDLNVVNNFTYEFWVKPVEQHEIDPEWHGWSNDGATGQKYVIYPGMGSNVYGPGHSIAGVSVGTNGVTVYEQTAGDFSALAISRSNIPNNSWTHVAVVVINKQPMIFINGVYINALRTSPHAFIHASLGFNPVAAGGGIGGGLAGFFNGQVDEVRVWNHARTVRQILSHKDIELTGLETGLVAYYKFNEGSGSSRVHGKAGSASLTNMNPATVWIKPQPIKDYRVTNSFTGTQDANYLYPIGTTQAVWTIKDKFNNIGASCTTNITVNSIAPPQLVCQDVTVVNDLEKCNAATSVPRPLIIPSACEGYALRFDGIDDAVELDKLLPYPNTFTYELWVRPTEPHEIDPLYSASADQWAGITGQHYVIYPSYAGANINPRYDMAGVSVGTNGISVYEHNQNWLPCALAWQSPTPLTAWTHISVVYENKKIFLFVNGMLVANSVSATPDPATSPVQPNLGSAGGGGGIGGGIYGYFKGDIDEVRVWNYARTASEIKADMMTELEFSEPGLGAYYNFNEGPGNEQGVSTAGPAVLRNMDYTTAWIQPDPIPDYTFSNELTGGGDIINWTFEVGSTPITWTVTDKHGKSTTCSSIVTVVDDQPPIVECPDNITVYVPDGSHHSKTVALEEIIASDNCGIKSIINDLNGGETVSGIFPVGTTDVNWVITDIHDNTTPCTGVQIIVEPTKLIIPNGISPNGDGANDSWVLHGLEYFDRADVKIYNRNGDLVYEGILYDNENVVFRGEANKGTFLSTRQLPTGTYFYYVTTVPDNHLSHFAGFLEISR